MTTLLHQQLLLYMLLALLLPRATYEQIRYDKAISQRKNQLNQVDKTVSEIQEGQLLGQHSKETTYLKQLIKSETAIGEIPKLIAKSEKVNSNESVSGESASLYRKGDINKIMQKWNETKAKEKMAETVKIEEMNKQFVSISKIKTVGNTNRKNPMLINQHNTILLTTSEESQYILRQAQKKKTFLLSKGSDTKKKHFASITKQPTIQVSISKTRKSQSGNSKNITESNISVLDGVYANSSSSARIKRQPQSEQQSRQSTSSIRLPQPQAQHQTIELNDFHSQLSLPAVPLPAPPPFPSSFSITPFGGATSKDVYKFKNTFAAAALPSSSSSSSSSFSSSSKAPSCGGILKQRFGIIQTPNFPRKFSVPLECIWIIDASELSTTATSNAASSSSSSSSSSSTMASTNVSIVVYLTQLYVLGGLKFTEYMYYSDDYKVPSHRVFQLTEDDVTQVASVQFNSQYLEVRFTMSSLDGTHLRALDRLLDVYGFNITYEVHHETKPYQCNTLQCRFLGHCFARADFR